MKNLKTLAYLFFAILLVGAVIHIIEIFYTKTFTGMLMAVIGGVGMVCVFALHAGEAGKKRKFRWRVSHIGLVAIILIVIGIAVNIACSFLFPEYVGVGNEFITWGFIVAVIGFFVYAVKEKGFK